jgi:hypothetical protein
MGMQRPVQLLARGAEVEDIVNAAALAVVEASDLDHEPRTVVHSEAIAARGGC